jgi:predicted alpha/beta superfamily hydrolase
LPVLYATDADFFFGAFCDLARSLQTSGAASPFVIVGVGYGGSCEKAALLRARDLYTHGIRSYFEDSLRAYVDRGGLGIGLDVVTSTTDSTHFLQFIRRELIPFVSAHYEVADPGYFGFSAGGGFGLHTLLTHPETFRRYIIGSPATSYGDRHYVLEWLAEARQLGRDIAGELFLSVGELEELDAGLENCNMVSGFHRLIADLTLRPVPRLNFTWRVFSGDSHATAWAPAFSHGVKALFPHPAKARD